MRTMILLLLLSIFKASAFAEIKTIDITIFGMD
jgi:hypothetical protein